MVAGKRIALVGFAQEEAARLSAVLEERGAFCRQTAAPDAGGALLRVLESFDAVLLAVGGTMVTDATVDALLESCVRPVLAIGTEENIAKRLVPLARPGRDYAVDPCSPNELLMRLATLPSGAAVRASGPTVVIADDDPVATAVLESTLGRHGIACHVAANGDEALMLAKQFRPAALVLDVNMPGRDGFQVLQDVKADPKTAHVRVLMLTGRADEHDVRRGCALGTDGYIAKPFKAADVAERVKALIEAGAAPQGS